MFKNVGGMIVLLLIALLFSAPILAQANPEQFVTKAEAAAIAKQVSSVYGGVVKTYVPEYFGPYATPKAGAKEFLHFKFANGSCGHNVGLIKQTKKQFPTRWISMLASEVRDGANSFFCQDQ